ncbi:MAG: type I-U CRISPR-associated protein Csb2 [Methanothrix sp.]|uniref:type I-G CRISPR-associated protein Csb2 n=1 Tax=Methanothrix sp. TaxID=90426 RepID=UPI0025EF8602|nr:type I-U CRISPR-associated protein Csb2 [Methanothrix sp.]MCQ8903236.1 type I-U CRISPR-associated protein Csb2 [Methanothrix sp.]
MILIECVLINGRFHATPWGRNVNEGIPEWPPSPYRLIRALYDTWKRKRPDWPASKVEPLLAALSSQLPKFCLPEATSSHIRCFLSQNKEDITKKQLIFDAFVVTERGAKIVFFWPDVNLSEVQKSDLSELLSLINYLGRSESWVSARLLPDYTEVAWNCVPEDGSSDPGWETVRVACPISADEYSKQPYNKSKSRPLRWLDALAWSTTELIKSDRRSEPPAFRYQNYIRHRHCLMLKAYPHRPVERPIVNGVLYAMESKVPPKITSAVEISERFRRKIMGIHKNITGDPKRISHKFSGKDERGHPLKGHKHLYVLPMDRDRDGFLDHLLAVCREPLDLEEQLALDRVGSIWQPDGKPDIRLIPVQWGRTGELAGTEPGTHFTSATPFIPPRHYRKGRGDFSAWLCQEVRREASNHGLPEPVEIRIVPKLSCSGRDIRWLEFRRSRKGESSRIGYGFDVVFPEPVAGPVALGYGAHFGLGLFVPSLKSE